MIIFINTFCVNFTLSNNYNLQLELNLVDALPEILCGQVQALVGAFKIIIGSDLVSLSTYQPMYAYISSQGNTR